MNAKVYQASGTVFFRNEFMKDHPTEYERTWEIAGAGQRILTTITPEEWETEIRRANPERNDQYGFCEIRDLKIEYVCEFEFKEDGRTPLCGDSPNGEHWTWFGNHEPDCPYNEE